VNGVLVSDFYTPDFFDPITVASVRYSFTGAIKSPRSVLKNGYISWNDPITRHWMQLRMFPDELSSKTPHVVDLNTQTSFGKFRAAGVSVRSAVDRVTRTPQRVQEGGKVAAKATRGAAKSVNEASASRADMWRAQIGRLKSEAGAPGGTPRGGRKRPR